jgi:hypothetical protein
VLPGRGFAVFSLLRSVIFGGVADFTRLFCSFPIRPPPLQGFTGASAGLRRALVLCDLTAILRIISPRLMPTELRGFRAPNLPSPATAPDNAGLHAAAR